MNSCPLGTYSRDGFCIRFCPGGKYFLNDLCYENCPSGLHTAEACVLSCPYNTGVNGNSCVAGSIPSC